LTLGTRDFNGSPRFSTGYVPLRNRPGILIETHMIKDYRSRVIGTYDFLRAALYEVNSDPQRLIEVGRKADQLMTTAHELYPLDFELTDEVTPFELKAFSYDTEQSEISGDLRVVFGKEPLDLTVPMYQTFRVTAAVMPPVAYIVPAQWQEVIEVIKAHGLESIVLIESKSIEVESYRFVNIVWPGGPFEGRHMPRFETETIIETREFPPSSLVVPLAQSLARIALNLLEPIAQDSFAHWGFFNAIFEEKEYGEHYVLETLAREMLEKDPLLAREFHERLTSDSNFAASPSARLRFFYKRSPYWDPQMNVYPVGRLQRAIDSI